MSKVQVHKVQTLAGHRDCVYALDGGPTENQIFSAAGDGMIVGWDLLEPENGTLIAKLPNSVYAIHHHKKTGLLIAGHNYEGIHLLDWQNKKEIGSLQVTKSAIFDIKSYEGLIIVACGDGVVSMIDVNNLLTVSKTQSFEKSARTIAVNENNGDIAIGYSDNYIRVYDQHLKLKSEWEAHHNSVFTLRYTPDWQFLMSGSRDARLKVWDVENVYKQAGEVVAHLYAINHIEFSPDGKHFVTCSMDKSIKVWNTDELKLLKVIDKARHAGHGTSVNKLLWTSFNNQLLSASDDRSISVWEIIF
jgi:WD40 repeat protein